MTLIELDQYFNSFLKKENFPCDPSLNGIQISNKHPDREILKVGFAVDACEATAKRAFDLGCGALFVHHGLLWGQCQTITDDFYKRVSAFIQNDIALIAYHIPLDANNPYGNNYGLAKRIGLTKTEPFGTWHGMTIGVKGVLKKQVTSDELSKMVLRENESPVNVFPFGKEKIKTVGIISGGAGEDVRQAVSEGLDAYITGEVMHQDFHYINEMGINVIAGGHYQTETMGVNLVMEKLKKEKKIAVEFIDIPTGL